MRVAIVFIAIKNRNYLFKISQELAKGIETQGHQVDVIDGVKQKDTQLSIYKYIAIGTEKISFLGKISTRVANFLSNAGIRGGKRCFAFVPKTIFACQRTMLHLMQAMEKEGMLIKYSKVLTSPEQAKNVGKRLHIMT